MSRKHVRYRVGIDVGLFSTGLSAVEIDDSDDDPRTALPIGILSSMSVLHDGGVDPSCNKTADSRKLVSGVARRARRMRKRRRQRLQKLDNIFEELGYPVEKAKALADGDGNTDPFLPWHARIQAANSYIENKTERDLAVTVSLRHIARHRGWRNPYTSVATVKEESKAPSKLYLEFVEKLYEWLQSNSSADVSKDFLKRVEILLSDSKVVGSDYPTPAQLVEPLLLPLPSHRFRNQKEMDEYPSFFGIDKDSLLGAHMGKLEQRDYYHEVELVLTTQKVPVEVQKRFFETVFQQVNPRDVGAAAELVAKDDLQPTKMRASRSSIAFQTYRVLTTVANLRLKSGNEVRPLTLGEKQKVADYLLSKEAAEIGELAWQDVASVLDVNRSALKGVGGITEDGEPISAKTPPILNTWAALIGLCRKNKEFKPMLEWWDSASELERDFLVESLGKAGVQVRDLSEEEERAYRSAMLVLDELGQLDDSSLQKLEGISLASGRASYCLDTLRRLNKRMYKEGLDLHEARKLEFGVGDDWQPSPNPLGTPTGNPAVDRTIKIVARWIKACSRKWGKPETVNIEHVRDGFITPKNARQRQRENDARAKANLAVRESMVEDGSVQEISAAKNADIRRWQAIQRQNSQCAYCGRKINFVTAQMDHIVPRKGVGSSNELTNLVATCSDCNASKSNTLFSKWADKEKLQEVLNRVDTWIRDSYFQNERQFKKFKSDVKSRLRQSEEDDPLDTRSIESVAWMARELRMQISGYFGYVKPVAVENDANDTFELQRVCVFRGELTAEARRASGIEKKLPWIGDSRAKTRLDRRHHAVDAAVIAMMRPGVAQVLSERSALRRAEELKAIPKSHIEKYGTQSWKQYDGAFSDSDDYSDSAVKKTAIANRGIYLKWRDVQMKLLAKLLVEAMNDDSIVVTEPTRLRLGNGRAHEDTVYKMYRAKVGDALLPASIDRVESPALWTALTRHPDYDEIDGLPEDHERRIRFHDTWLNADDEIGFMAKSHEGFLGKVETNAVYAPVRGGFAAIGETIHHARFYRIPKLNRSGKQTGWLFAQLRVFQIDLLKHQSKNLFSVELPQSSYSVRFADKKLRSALQTGTAEYLGWAVAGDEVILDPETNHPPKERLEKINYFMRAFPDTKHFQIVGFGTKDKLTLRPMMIAEEGLPDFNNGKVDFEKIYGPYNWQINEVELVNKVISAGWVPSVDRFMTTLPTFIHRDALGRERWRKKNNMPTCWKVKPHPEL